MPSPYHDDRDAGSFIADGDDDAVGDEDDAESSGVEITHEG